jgi:hypothetical protein
MSVPIVKIRIKNSNRLISKQLLLYYLQWDDGHKVPGIISLTKNLNIQKSVVSNSARLQLVPLNFYYTRKVLSIPQ